VRVKNWRDMFRKKSLDKQFDTELAFHIERLTEDKIAAGVPPTEARRQAMLEFGGREQMKEELRDVHRMQIVDTTAANLKSAVRFMRKSPTLSITVILTLALGIGANCAVMSAIDAILLRPLPFPHADRLVAVHEFDRKQPGPQVFVAPIRLEEWNRLSSTFTALTGYYTDDSTESSGELPEKVTVAGVSPRFLQVWGVAPAAGRDFTREEYHSGGPGAALITDRYAVRHFGSAANAIGRPLRLGKGGGPGVRVVGVMPPSFAFPVRDVDIWFPVPADAALTQSRTATWYTVIGRLKPGVTIQQANADLATVQAQLGKQYPKPDADLTLNVEGLKAQMVGGVRRSLWTLFGAVSLLLLIACTNVAALLLARTTERRREIAIRFALGASRPAVILQLLTETLVLALAGSAAGLAIVWISGSSFATLAKTLPRVREIAIDWRLVVYTVACALIAAIACGLLPALRLTRRGISGALAQGGRAQVSAGGRLQWTLVGVQVALAVTLLAGAGLMLRSFQALGRVDPGFDPAHVLTFHVSGSWAETANMKALANRINRTIEALRTMPGVEGAATTVMLPGVEGMEQTQVDIDEQAHLERKVTAHLRFVSFGYFDTMKIPMMAGEACRESADYDTAVVNRSFAETYMSGSSPIGYHLSLKAGNLEMPPSRIIGVAADAREQAMDDAPEPTVYECFSAPTPNPWYIVRTAGLPGSMAQAIRWKMHQIEPARSVYGIEPLEQHIYDAFGERRLRAVLLSLFALIAASLASIGIYGTLTYVVTGRRREVGLRLALGAAPSSIVQRFLMRGVTVTLVGSLAGLCLAAAFTRALAGMLYGITPTDPATFAGVLTLVFGVGAMASLWPAIRAAHVDPMEVLREE
jgi:putative ABC transport system permease protein